MIHGLYLNGPEQISVHESPEPPLAPGQVRVRSHRVSVKHGTMFHLYSGRSPFEGQRFDTDQRLFVPDETSHPCNPQYLGGGVVVGEIIECGEGVDDFSPGEMVYGLCTCCDVVDLWAAGVRRLDGLRDDQALCLDPSIFALGGILDGRPHVGDRVLVSGLGAIGLIAVQILSHSGVRLLAVSDPDPRRRELAAQFGADLCVDPTATDLGPWSREHCDGAGFDCAIEYSGHVNGLAGCLRAVRQCGRIVTVGYYKGGAEVIKLGAEWLHNRLDLICSLVDWGNPMRAPGWDRQRVIDTAVDCMHREWIDGRQILDPVVRLEEAPACFDAIYRDPSKGIKLTIDFGK
jgi:threonine dehydrogenase-like Zn-dependent dehydrogenase